MGITSGYTFKDGEQTGMAKKLNLAFSGATDGAFTTLSATTSLGVGTTTPNLMVEILGTASTLNPSYVGTRVSADASGSGLLGIKGRGTIASPDFPNAADVLLTLGGGGWNGTTLYTFNKATILLRALNTWVAGGSPDNSTDISFQTTPAASVTRAEVFRLASAQITALAPLSLKVASASNATLVDVLTGFTTYGCVSLNNTKTIAGILGFYGGDGSDGNLYMNATTGFSLKLSVNNASAATINPTSATFVGIMACAGAATSASSGFVFPVGTTALSSLRVPHGVAPTSAVNGDIWTTTLGLFVRINGATVGPLT